MRIGSRDIIAILLMIATCALAQLEGFSEQCSYDMFPIFFGGKNGDEKVSCFVYDEKHDLILIGGNTTSDDFAPGTENV